MLKIAATSPLVLSTFNLFGKTNIPHEKTVAPVSGSNGKKIAIFSAPSTGSHTLAHYYFYNLSIQEKSGPLFYNDELGLGDLSDKAQADIQRNQFEEKIKNIGEAESGVFSFRNLFEENVDYVLANLKRLNFKLIWVEPKDIKASALNWSFAGASDSAPTSLWNSHQKRTTDKPVNIEREYLNFYINRYSRFVNLKAKIGGMDVEVLSQGSVESLLSDLGAAPKRYLWKDYKIDNPSRAINNIEEVKDWLAQWKIS